jgi:7-cyano-7-deazaguanine synthase
MNIIAICSGGLDSTVMFYLLKKQGYNVLPVNFSYGSKHNTKEREFFRLLFKEIKHKEIDIDLSFLKSSLLDKNINVPEGHYADASMKSTVVPFRNAIMLSYAVAMAESEGFNSVAIGNHTGDHAIYPDCRKSFITSFSDAVETGTYNKIKILSPLGDIDKKDIVRTGIELGIGNLLFNTWSCYKGGDVHCGKCGTCYERKEAFLLAGITDKTVYGE